MAIVEFVSISKDVIVGLSVFATAVIAYRGLTAWKNELKEKSEYQLAKNLLKSVYLVHKAFIYVRSPIIYQSAYPENMKNTHGHLSSTYDYEGMAHVYEQRWEAMEKAFSELEQYYLDAQIEWTEESENKILKLRSCRIELLIAIQDMLEKKKNPSEIQPSQKEEEEQIKQRGVLRDLGKNSISATFNKKINDAVEEFKQWLIPHIKKIER